MTVRVKPVITAESSVNMVLLPGWGFNSNCWQPLLPDLQQLGYSVYLVDIDYAGETADGILRSLLDQLPNQFVIMGWSLGGMLATQLAAKYPERVTGLINLSSNTKFVVSDDYSTAMPVDIFHQFYQSVEQHPQKARNKFSRLQVYGARLANEQLVWVKNLLHRFTPDMLAGLQLLAAIDNRDELTKIKCPNLWLFGEHDALVPVASAKTISAEKMQVKILSNSGHLLHFPKENITALIAEFLSAQEYPNG